MRVLLETDNAIVGFDESRKAMLVLWGGVPDKEEFYAVSTNVLKGFKIFFAHTLVIDFEKYSKIGANNLNYLMKHVFPMATKCGLKKLVIISLDKKEETEITHLLREKITYTARKVTLDTAQNVEEAFSKLAV